MPVSEESGVHSVIWDRPERAAKGPAPAYSRAAIAAAAVSIADSDGADGVSMRRIAAALGTGATSLYRYVTSKDELLDLMIDAVEGEDGGPAELTEDWREDLTAVAYRMRATIRRHPWMATLVAGRPNLGPNRLATTEQGLAALDPLRLDIDEQLAIMVTIEAFVRGYALGEFAEEEATRRSGVTMEMWMESYTHYMRAIIDEGRHPHVAQVVIDATTPHAPDRADLGFAKGLARILNGIEADL
jgi:AcrR family transcriptional regulator